MTGTSGRRGTARLTKQHSAWVAGIACCTLALMAGCGNDDKEPETLPSGDPTSETTPSTSDPTNNTSEPPTPKEEAAAGAEQAIRNYLAFTDELIADGGVDLKRLSSFLQDPELTDRRIYFQRFRDQGFYSDGGSTSFEWFKVSKVRIFPDRNEAAVSMAGCRNFDEVDVRFESGEPVQTLSPSLATYEVYNYDWPNATGWKIAVENEPGERCKP